MKKTRHGNVDTLRATWWSRSLRLTASQLILWGPHCSGKTYIYSIFIPPTSMKLKGGYTGFMLFVRPCLRPSLDGIVSALYLRQYLLDSYHIYSSHQSNFQKCVTCKACCKIPKFEFLAKFRNSQNAGVLVVLVYKDIKWHNKKKFTFCELPCWQYFGTLYNKISWGILNLACPSGPPFTNMV